MITHCDWRAPCYYVIWATESLWQWQGGGKSDLITKVWAKSRVGPFLTKSAWARGKSLIWSKKVWARRNEIVWQVKEILTKTGWYRYNNQSHSMTNNSSANVGHISLLGLPMFWKQEILCYGGVHQPKEARQLLQSCWYLVTHATFTTWSWHVCT